VSEGDRPSSLFCRQPAEPALWLDSSVRRPGGAFPWAFLNRLADLPRALPLDLPGVGEVRDVGPQGRVTAPFCVDGPAGEPYVAAVWARGGDMRLSLVAADGRRELASALARASADWKAALLAWPRWAHTAQARLRVEAAGAEPVQVCGAFVARGRTPPDAWTAPRQPGAVDLAASIRVSLNGRKAFDGPAPPDGVVRLVVPPSPPAGLCKTDILKGPIAHAFESPFLLVYGTGGDDRDWRVAFEEAWSFRDEWKARCGVPCRIRADREVGDEDARRFNLVLFGGPTVNSVAARVMPAMPVRIEGGAAVAGERRFAGEDVGVKVIYPNPLNPDRYVAVFAGVTWRGMFQITRRFGAWFGWRVHEHRDWYDFVVFDDVSRDPASFLLVGWFDERWRMAGETTWEGDAAWRAGAPRRAVPILAGPDPDCDETWLSEMEPWRSTLRLGAVGLDRSFRGNALRPGGVECRRGLGVRIEGGVAYDLRGMCDRFRAIVGIDNEGETPTAERQAVTRVRFEVWGDGRRLAWSATHHWNDPPETMDADVRGVRILELRAVGMGSRPWVYGSVAWGEARVSLAR
jgi:hypothetical protein